MRTSIESNRIREAEQWLAAQTWLGLRAKQRMYLFGQKPHTRAWVCVSSCYQSGCFYSPKSCAPASRASNLSHTHTHRPRRSAEGALSVNHSFAQCWPCLRELSKQVPFMMTLRLGPLSLSRIRFDSVDVIFYQ